MKKQLTCRAIVASDMWCATVRGVRVPRVGNKKIPSVAEEQCHACIEDRVIANVGK